MRQFSLVFLLSMSICFFAPFAKAQTTLNWNTLADVQLEEKYDAEAGINYYTGIFGTPMQFDQQEIVIQGFVIPLDALGTQYVLSRNPQTSCFFCGGAGPETVIKLQLKPSAFKRYKTDARRSFKGILKLNADTKNDLLYILDEAEEF